MDDREHPPEIAMARPFVTYGLIAANALVFAAMVSSGAAILLPESLEPLRRFGAADASSIWLGQGWRLFAAVFVHGAIWHLGMNMWVLYQVGDFLENALGRSRFLLLYLVSGVAGFCFSTIFRGGVSVGASGAIFGVVGGLLGLALITDNRALRSRLISSLSLFVIATLLLGFLVPFVDNAAHIGGLVTGFLFSYALLADNKRHRLLRLAEANVISRSQALEQRPRFSMSLIIIFGLAFAGLLAVANRPFFSPRYHVVMGFDALERGDDAALAKHIARAEALGPDDPLVLLLRGYSLRTKDPQRAEDFGRLAIERQDKDPLDALMGISQGLGGDGRGIDDEALMYFVCSSAIKVAGAAPAATLRNNCAWATLTFDDHALRDPVVARAWSERAVADAKKTNVGGHTLAQFLHTLAEAQVRTGDIDGGIATLERVQTESLTDDVFFKRELERLRRLK